MARPLTAVAIKNLKPGEKRREIPDPGSPGLYLVLQKSGAMSWALRCRVEGKPVKVTLGTVNSEKAENDEPQMGGYITLGEARVLAAQQRHLLAQGRDPREVKTTAVEAAEAAADAKQKEKVAAVVAEFLKKHTLAKRRRSAPEVKRLFDKHVIPYWGNKAITELTRKDIVARLDEIAVKTPIQANRVLANLRKLLNWAVSRDIISTSPAAAVSPPGAETSRDRVLSEAEIRALWEATGILGYPFGDAFRLLLATAQRRDEVGSMRYAELDLDAAQWLIPRERAKNDTENLVPLSPLALGILQAVPRIEGRAGYVFTTTGETAISGWTKAKVRLDEAMHSILVRDGLLRETDPLPHFKIHDLRRTAASNLARIGVAPHVVEAVLAHKSGTIKGVAAVYNRYGYEAEKRTALTIWADEILRIVGEWAR